MSLRSSKVVSLREAAASIPDGSIVAVGGLSYYGAPMALVRELIRQGVRDLTVITAAVTSIQADLLIAAGAVRKIMPLDGTGGTARAADNRAPAGIRGTSGPDDRGARRRVTGCGGPRDGGA